MRRLAHTEKSVGGRAGLRKGIVGATSIHVRDHRPEKGWVGGRAMVQ